MGTSRLEAFSDGIIAIAATLLVIELAAPEPGADVWEHLHHELPSIAAYAVSFVTILIYWVNHHALLADVATVDRALLFLNGFLLLCISSISFPTAVLGRALQAGGRPAIEAAVFYTAVLTLAAVSFLALWVYLGRHPHLLHPHARGITLAASRRGAFGACCYAVSVGVAFLNGTAALVVVALLALFFALPPRRRRTTPRPTD
ncbi:putative membrane protein [Lapillicoccus jejuensis]|uniref:Putative membrane protein n=2 Tax=Lapillicoccus jejuensis TaxID=402171 RepID=A0A542E1L0_9MICO|nr:putative membrane protein [Lapillicoccus jejuensis]